MVKLYCFQSREKKQWSDTVNHSPKLNRQKQLGRFRAYYISQIWALDHLYAVPVINQNKDNTIPGQNKPHTVVSRQWKSTFYLRSKLREIKQGNQCTTSFSYFIFFS